tara:strand:- start:4 stop:687 length:684 start_codon:yes stop_codon:yes gene_type:complete
MHVEPGIVQASKIGLSYGTAFTSIILALKATKLCFKEDGPLSFIFKTFMTTLLVFTFFEVFPHYPVGVSEVHFILGSTLFLLFGTAPAAFGLALGLLIQGLFFAPTDIPQYGVNVTTLLIPLFAMSALAKKVIPKNTAYKDIKYADALKLSLTYQGGVVAWVAFWAFYGQGFGAENLASVASFGASYMSVVLLEPFIDLALLAAVKTWSSPGHVFYFHKRLFEPLSK